MFTMIKSENSLKDESDRYREKKPDIPAEPFYLPPILNTRLIMGLS